MPNIEYEIEATFGDDIRLSEIPIKIVIKNQSDKRIKILTIAPNIPKSVDLYLTE
jgi:hypothetical protein